MKNILSLIILSSLLLNCKSETKDSRTVAEAESPFSESVEAKNSSQEIFEVTPISHATMVLNWNGTIIYVDPVGGASSFEGQPLPDLILITDIHGDHLSVETLKALNTERSKIMVPQAVADKLPADFDAQVDVLNNGDTKERFGFNVEAIPMYNLREEALKFHIKGRGNGYVITKEGKRVYISGDTEDIPEMRALKDIDVAFVCMNLPYTMTELSAAKAVVEFKPKKVYPYHYRGAEGFSDVAKFKAWIMKSGVSDEIEVVQLDWYPG
jgi:L-ascorbate metabolism protein UlaG (beta-lactamase superfamily)